jgi:hypothetical protein
VEKCLSEQSSLMTRKRLRFAISEPAEYEQNAGSSDKISESAHASGSSYTNSIPSTASPERRKRKRTDDEEDPAHPSYLNQLPKNLLMKNQQILTPLLPPPLQARKLIFLPPDYFT